MTPNRVHEGSVRPGQLEYSRLAWALAASIALHLLCFGTYQLGKRLDLWNAIQLPAWLHKSKLLTLIPEQPKQSVVQPEPPLVYVDVNPDFASAEPPDNTRFYSSRSSIAANPETDQDTGIPKISGTQTQVPKAEDTPRSPYDRLMPDFSRLTQNQQAEQAKPTAPDQAGDLAMARPDAQLRDDKGAAEQTRPRTIKEALLRQHRNQLMGEKMKQAGGVSRLQLSPGFDVRSSAFGQYDAEFIQAVQSRWYDLLDSMSFDGYRRGHVIVEFRLYYDGRITDMKVLDNDVGEVLALLCQKAVLDPAPFDKWSREMRLKFDKDYREMKFTFYYN